jgi:hypothetical protein
MSVIKRMIRLAWALLGLVSIVALAIGPDFASRTVDEALHAWWRTLGDQLTNRELNAIARQLDQELHSAERIETLRDGLAERLQSLGLQRDCRDAILGEGCRSGEASVKRELAHLDAAIVLLRSTLARADLALGAARRDLREREAELTGLQVAAEVSRMDRALAGPIGDPSLWRVRVARAGELVGSSCTGLGIGRSQAVARGAVEYVPTTCATGSLVPSE